MRFKVGDTVIYHVKSTGYSGLRKILHVDLSPSNIVELSGGVPRFVYEEYLIKNNKLNRKLYKIRE